MLLRYRLWCFTVYIVFVFQYSYILYTTRYKYIYYTITALQRDQYEVLWSRVQQYWSSSSVVIVLLHKAQFYSNFDIFENFIILKFFQKFEILWKFSNFMKVWKVFKFYENLKSFQILWKFYENFEFFFNF